MSAPTGYHGGTRRGMGQWREVYGRELARQDRFGASSGTDRWQHQRLPRPDDHDPQQVLANYGPEWAPMTFQGAQTQGLGYCSDGSERAVCGVANVRRFPYLA